MFGFLVTTKAPTKNEEPYMAILDCPKTQVAIIIAEFRVFHKIVHSVTSFTYMVKILYSNTAVPPVSIRCFYIFYLIMEGLMEKYR